MALTATSPTSRDRSPATWRSRRGISCGWPTRRQRWDVWPEPAACLRILRLNTLPVSVRLIREMHATILAGARGRQRQPGELKRTQNWIGPPGATIETATFVPPPPAELGPLLTDLERFVHEEPQLPPLVQAAQLHYQFETIHPFLDGNGRLGRLLIVFFLVVRGRLPEPLLYLSPFFESRRQRYYEALQRVREQGDFDGWLEFFLEGVTTQAIDAVTRAERLTDLRERYRSRVQATTRGAANQLVDVVFEQPVVNAHLVESRLGVSRPAALSALRRLEALDVLHHSERGPAGPASVASTRGADRSHRMSLATESPRRSGVRCCGGGLSGGRGSRRRG